MQLIESCIVPFSLSIRSGPPRIPASSVLACNAISGFPGIAPLSRVGDEAAGCPAPSVHGLCRRWIFGYPRSSHASASPVSSDRQVALLRRLPLCNAFDPVLRSPLALYRPAVPVMEFRVAPALSTFGGADWPFHRLPRFPVFRYRRRLVLRVAPRRESSGYGWLSSRSPWTAHPPFPLCNSLVRLPRFLCYPRSQWPV